MGTGSGNPLVNILASMNGYKTEIEAQDADSNGNTVKVALILVGTLVFLALLCGLYAILKSRQGGESEYEVE